MIPLRRNMVRDFLCQTWHNQTDEKYQRNFNAAEK